MSRTRDYKAEYRRRIANAEKRGLSRSQARGHPKPNEAPVRLSSQKDRERLEAALREMRRSGNLTQAAKASRMAPERLRRHIYSKQLAKRSGRSWVFTDNRLREMTVVSDGEAQVQLLAGFDQASLNGKHLAAIKAFLASNEFSHLLPFVDQSVVDAAGVSHPLETDPNTLYRIAASGTEVFHEVYRLTP